MHGGACGASPCSSGRRATPPPKIGYRLSAGETVIALLEANRHVAEHVVTEADIANLARLYRTQRQVKYTVAPPHAARDVRARTVDDGRACSGPGGGRAASGAQVPAVSDGAVQVRRQGHGAQPGADLWRPLPQPGRRKAPTPQRRPARLTLAATARACACVCTRVCGRAAADRASSSCSCVGRGSACTGRGVLVGRPPRPWTPPPAPATGPARCRCAGARRRARWAAQRPLASRSTTSSRSARWRRRASAPGRRAPSTRRCSCWARSVLTPHARTRGTA